MRLLESNKNRVDRSDIRSVPDFGSSKNKIVHCCTKCILKIALKKEATTIAKKNLVKIP